VNLPPSSGLVADRSLDKEFDDGLLLDPDAASFDAFGENEYEADGDQLHDFLQPKPTVSDRNVPGQYASSVHVNQMWSSWPKTIFRSRTHFSCFYRAQCSKSQRGDTNTAIFELWPMPLPYHFGGGKNDRSAEDQALDSIVNLQVCFLNFLAMGQPSSPPDCICGRRSLNDDQWNVVNRLRRLSKAWTAFSIIAPAEMGRTAAKQERQEQALAALAGFSIDVTSGLSKYGRICRPVSVSNPSSKVGKVVGSVKTGSSCVAQSIVADRIKMEGTPSFDPRPFLPEDSLKLFNNPFVQNIKPEDLPDSPPRVRVHASLKDKLGLLKLLNKTNRLTFRKPCEVHRHFGNGLFCVPKSLDVDRLILDARPSNLLQVPPNNFILSMGSPTTLTGIFLEEREKLLMTGDDLSNFFYTFKVGYDRGTKNFLEWRIPTKLVSGLKGFPKSLAHEPFVFACLNTLAMGDSAACEYAQTSHLALGIQSGAISPQELLSIHGRVPRSPSMQGIIIDDFILLQKVQMSDTIGADMERRRAAMHSIYRAVGLEPHPTKGFANQSSASFWGADVDGLEGLVRGNIVRAASLCWVTSQVIALGVCSVELLEVIAGGFVALFGFRRRLMSLIDLTYSAQGGRNKEDVIGLSVEHLDELWSLCILCPLAVADLRAGFADRVYMVDASNWGDAVCAADLDKFWAKEVHRHSLSRSCWTKLLSPYKANLRGKGVLPTKDELPDGEEFYSEHPVWEILSRGLQYKTCWKRRAKQSRHINIGELRSYLKEECIAGRRRSDIRVPIGGDSQVAAGAICKGRSASKPLNRELKQSLPFVLGLGIYSSPGYTKSQHNPSDDPTRGKTLRCPDVELPDWWLAGSKGDFDSFDSFLHAHHLRPEDLAGFDNLGNLSAKNGDLFGVRKLSNSQKVKAAARQKLIKRKKVDGIVSHDGVAPNSVNDSKKVFPWTDEVMSAFEFFGKEQFFFRSDQSWPPSQPGYLDLYSGQKGFAKAAVACGAPWVLTIDICDGPQCDLLSHRVRQALLESGCIVHLSAAPICASFSRAITPAVRSKAEPKGIQPMRPTMARKILDGNSHSRFLAALIPRCLQLHIFFWVENPDASYLWSQPEWQKIPGDAVRKFFRVDYCVFKTPWRKRTKFVTNGRLQGVKQLCTRDHTHRVLRGRGRGQPASWTKMAEAYPTALCGVLAAAACADTQHIRHSNLHDISRCSHCRIGEAKNPGPRRPRAAPREADRLDSVELIRPETIAIGVAQWEIFVRWVVDSFGRPMLDSLWLSPPLMGYMVAAYGRHAFEAGRALFNFRHLVVYIQRSFAGMRGNLGPAWEILNRWEELEPVEHRRPIPKAMIDAMVSLAILWSWWRVACVLLIAFHGCCRPGEVLLASRVHLVFPGDIGQHGGPIFFRIQKPKPGRRGLGRVQHTKILSEAVGKFLAGILFDLQPQAPIYFGSAGAFRTRWNRLLLGLKVPLSCGLTPAGLRAGGTVELYRQGCPISDILWTLRLKKLETLQHYLQEVSTQITMVDLPLDAKQMIYSFSELLPHFLSIHGL